MLHPRSYVNAMGAFIASSSPFFRLSSSRRCHHNVTTCAASQNSSTVISWNVNSLRALLRKDPNALNQLVQQHQPDVLCLQETKLQEDHEPLFLDVLSGYPMVVFNSSTTRRGYSGTAIYSKYTIEHAVKEIGHGVGDAEGRVVGFEFPGLFLLNVYTMNSGKAMKRLHTRMEWDRAFRKFIRSLRFRGKPLMVIGDLNVAHSNRDVYNPSECQGIPGFSPTEQQSFDGLLETCDLVDAFRMLYPTDERRFTYWDYKSRARQRNDGWRIDYALVTRDMTPAVRDVRILDDVLGSDHCPVAVDLAPGFFAESKCDARFTS